MPFTMADMANVETENPVRRAVLDTLRKESKLLDMMTFETINAMDMEATVIDTLPAVTTRQLYDGFAESSGTTRKKRFLVSDVGGDVQVDRRYSQAKNVLENPKVTQLRMKRKAMKLAMCDYFINGDPSVDPLLFPGIRTIIGTLPAEQTLDAGSLDLSTGALRGTNGQTLLDFLDIAFQRIEGEASMIIANETLIAHFASLVRRNASNLLQTTRDTLGRFITEYRGVPFVDPGRKADQTTKIVTDAVDGAGLTSMYIVKVGFPEYFFGIQEVPLEVSDWYMLQAKSNMVEALTISWPVGTANVSDRSMARIKNIKVA
jgi:hypothetical protein